MTHCFFHFLCDTLVTENAIDTTRLEMDLLRTLFAILGFFALLLLTGFAIKRWIQQRPLGKGGYRYLKLLERRVLSPKTSLFLFEIEGKQLLIAESMAEVELLPLKETLSKEVTAP